MPWNLSRAVDIALQLAGPRGFNLLPNRHAVGLLQKKRTNYERDSSDHNRIVQPGVDISRLRDDRQSDQRQQSAENSVANMVANPPEEQRAERPNDKPHGESRKVRN